MTTKAWQPTDNDHLIFDWVKMQGKTQGEVASLLSIHQGTVSRVIQRYERWLAHRADREDGRLDPQERLRAQRQLTFDRNELILSSCLRIAQDMEGSLDGSRSVITRPMSNYTQEKEIRTTHFTLDRTGTVCRFLRLAFRVNMEQEKLALRMAKEGDAPAAPLTDEELSEQARQAALDAAEMSAGTLRVREREPVDSTDPVGWAEPTTSPDQDLVTSVPPGDARTRGSSLGDSPTTSSDQPDPKLDHPGPTLNPEPRTLNPGAHNAHNADPLQIAASTAKPCTCVVEIGSKKNSHARTTDAHQPRHKEMKASNQTRLGSHSRRAKAIK